MYSTNIKKEITHNDNYRKVLFTTPNSMQIVAMSLLPQEDIGEEVHTHTTQYFQVFKGLGIAEIDGVSYALDKHSYITVPPNTIHNIINPSPTQKLKLLTIYTPPEHPPNTIEKTKYSSVTELLRYNKK